MDCSRCIPGGGNVTCTAGRDTLITTGTQVDCDNDVTAVLVPFFFSCSSRLDSGYLHSLITTVVVALDFPCGFLPI